MCRGCWAVVFCARVLRRSPVVRRSVASCSVVATIEMTSHQGYRQDCGQLYGKDRDCSFNAPDGSRQLPIAAFRVEANGFVVIFRFERNLWQLTNSTDAAILTYWYQDSDAGASPERPVFRVNARVKTRVQLTSSPSPKSFGFPDSCSYQCYNIDMPCCRWLDVILLGSVPAALVSAVPGVWTAPLFDVGRERSFKPLDRGTGSVKIFEHTVDFASTLYLFVVREWLLKPA
jgi:hypothetical protein